MVGARSSGRTGTALFEHERYCCCCSSCDDLSSLRKVLLDSCHAAVEFPPSITVVADDDGVVVAGLTSNDMERDGNCLFACVCVERCRRRRRCVQ